MPSGTVTFLNGSAVLGIGSLSGTGKATLTTSALSLGSYSISAQYGGNASYSASTSSLVSLTINPTPTPTGTLTLTLSTSSVQLQPGQSSQVTVQMTPQGGFNKTVSLSCTGLPAGVSCSFKPAAVTVAQGPASTTMNVSSGTTAASTSARLSGVAYGAILPWNLIGMLAMAAARKRQKLGMLRAIILMVLTGAGAMTIAGCGVIYNTTAQTYHVTLTAQADGATVQTSTFDVVLWQKVAPF